jgi:hypothetical protein
MRACGAAVSRALLGEQRPETLDEGGLVVVAAAGTEEAGAGRHGGWRRLRWAEGFLAKEPPDRAVRPTYDRTVISKCD